MMFQTKKKGGVKSTFTIGQAKVDRESKWLNLLDTNSFPPRLHKISGLY